MELSLKIPAAQRQEKRRYPDSVIEDALLGVFIILPLGVDINPIDGQVFPYLSKVEQRSKVFWLVCTKGYLLRQEIWGHSTCMISPTGDQTSSAGRGVCVCVCPSPSLWTRVFPRWWACRLWRWQVRCSLSSPTSSWTPHRWGVTWK